MQQARLDPPQFEQVLYNLLLNAAQAMKHQGSITVLTEVGDGLVEIIVHDTGPGLPPGVDEKLFKPFYTTRTEGTGLGLAIVKKIVTAHGGSIEASNRPEGGAEFRIRLAAEPPVR
jgi:signal transduction histidine kinase